MVAGLNLASTHFFAPVIVEFSFRTWFILDRLSKNREEEEEEENEQHYRGTSFVLVT